MATPVLLVHGWGGSFATTWESTGFTQLLADAGRPVIGVDLLGHGTAPKPHEPEAYADLTARVLDAMPPEPIDAVGFSLGALTLLQIACEQPHRFSHLVLAGVGQGVFEPDDAGTERIISGLEGTAPADDNLARHFANYARQPGNDIAALTAIMKRPRAATLTPASVSRASCPTTVVIGDRDFGWPGDALAGALPAGSLVVLRNVDHFATPESFGFIDATLQFLGAVPV
ncbi:MAG: putative hydrolase [Acidimicrobiaceae bacterium]|jgi:pimeloyl-ACP methyl ester carboxylesterase|nr:MAG: putative hydrolase [Acidimicrobiaceae bacterium]